MENQKKYDLLKRMTQYTGTKTVKATPMNLGEAEELLERKMYKDGKGDPGAMGYLVMYEDGYMSWSPAFTFESCYAPSQTYVERMKIEIDEVRYRYLTGRDFSFSQTFRKLTETQQDLLRKQLDAMEHYLYILSRRIQVEEELEDKNYTASCDGGRIFEMPDAGTQSEPGGDVPSGEK